MSKGYKKTAACATTCLLLALFARMGEGADISKILRTRGLLPSETSVMVMDAETGRVLASHQPDAPMNPASCAKIVTSAAAFSQLGPDYRFHTDFYADRWPDDGEIAHLYIYGTGDPILVSEDLWRMARSLAMTGLKKITGGIVVDESFFDSSHYPRKEGSDERAYTAKTSATALNFDSAAISVAPGRRAGAQAVVTVEPPVDYIRIVNKVVTGGKYFASVKASIEDGREVLTVQGRIPPRSAAQYAYRSIADPPSYFASAVKLMLVQNGVQADGPVKKGTVPRGAALLLSEKSKPLSEIVRGMNKFSNNFIAEQTLKHMGAVKFGAPGSTEKGVRAVSEYLASIGIRHGSYVMENGSGLSDKTRFSASLLAKVLVAAYGDFSMRAEFMDSLAVLGIDGTMRRWKFEPSLTGKLRAKTGTLDNVSSLAGFVPTARGQVAAFAILVNGRPSGAGTAHRAEVEIVKAIAEGN